MWGFHKDEWQILNNAKHTKLFLSEPKKHTAKSILCRKQSYNLLDRHIFRIGILEDDSCRSCHGESGSREHCLCERSTYGRIGYSIFHADIYHILYKGYHHNHIRNSGVNKSSEDIHWTHWTFKVSKYLPQLYTHAHHTCKVKPNFIQGLQVLDYISGWALHWRTVTQKVPSGSSNPPSYMAQTPQVTKMNSRQLDDDEKVHTICNGNNTTCSGLSNQWYNIKWRYLKIYKRHYIPLFS